jgi:voltage-gated potassium channel
VVIGWNQFGKDVVDQLVGVYKKVAIVTNVINDVDLIRETYDKKLVYVIFSDMANFELISKTNIHLASAVFINLKDDTEKLVYILNMKKHFGNLKFVVTLDNSSLKQTFHSAGTTYTVTKNEISSKLVASYIFEPDVAEYSENIMSYAETDDDHDIKEYKVIGHCAFCKKDYEYAFIHLKKQYNSVLIGISKLIEGKRILFKNPSEPLMVEEGDYLLMITTKKADLELQKLFQIEEGYMGD